jgi:hypothetical protein
MKAYRVEENWSITKTMTVWAENAEDAKRKVRRPDPGEDKDVEVNGEFPEPRSITARREPSEDTDE